MLDAATTPDPSRQRDQRSLRQRALLAGVWTIAGFGFIHVLRFAANLLMARLLVPDMFGLMAIASSVMMALAMFSDVGLGPNILRSRRGNDPNFLNTAWSIQIIRGVILWVLALGIALAIALMRQHGSIASGSVYGDPSLPFVLVAISFIALIQGLISTRVLEARRNLALGRITLIEIVSQLSSILCMLIWAIFDRSVSALIAANIAGALVLLILSHTWLVGTRNRWNWDHSAVNEIVKFGAWIFGSSILFFMATNSDRLLLGGLVSPTILGVYAIALNIYSSLEQILTKVVSGVAFPAMSEVVREGKANLRASFYKMHTIIAVPAYFAAGALAISGEPLIELLYDTRYYDAGWMLEILALGFVVVPFQIAIQYFIALGKPNIQFAILAIRLLALVVGMPLGFYLFGVRGAVQAIPISSLLSVPIIVGFSIRNGLFDLKKELVVLPAAAVGVFAGFMVSWIVLSFKNYVFN